MLPIKCWILEPLVPRAISRWGGSVLSLWVARAGMLALLLLLSLASAVFRVAPVWTVEESTFCLESLPNITPKHKSLPLLPVNLGWRTYLS